MAEPDWMPKAVRAAHTLGSVTVGHARAGHSVYVILLHDMRRHQRWGLYVGQTSRDPDWRFDQHKAGYKASASVRRFGVCLLPVGRRGALSILPRPSSGDLGQAR